MRTFRCVAAMIAATVVATVLPARPLRGEAVTVDAADAAIDAVIDGFPGIAEFDGEPDLGGNTLAVALKILVTEERAIIEFPLDDLADVDSGSVTSATLAFNIDDVLSTFGPGTDFSGRAARTILIHTFSGDGQVDLEDYKNIAADPYVVDTTPLGNITDATLRESGPLVFDIDVTADLQALLDDGGTHFGVVFRTTDNPTGTSLDDLGDASGGPPGVNGARLPLLTIEINEATPTATAPEPTATPTVGSGCPGDCSADGAVSVDELVLAVNIGLGGNAAQCRNADGNNDQTVTVDELVQAVAAALNGCS